MDGSGGVPVGKSEPAAQPVRCSFCDKLSAEVGKLIAGPVGINICDACVEACTEILAEDGAGRERTDDGQWLSVPAPRKLCDLLGATVIGHEQARKQLAVAIYRHYRRSAAAPENRRRQEENVLLVGATGTGKTLLAETLARLVGVPMSLADATALTAAGYVGDDVETILVALYRAADNNLARAQRGIVYIDQIDKIARKRKNPSITRDVSGEAVQQGLLKILGGCKVDLDLKEKRKHPRNELLAFDTKDVLFVCGGTFEGIENIVRGRLAKAAGQRLEEVPATPQWLRGQISPADLVAFGFLPEFVWRFAHIVVLDPLTEGELKAAFLAEPDSIRADYERLFAAEGVKLRFQDDAVTAVARAALLAGGGVRGLKRVMDGALLDVLFDLPGRIDVAECIVGARTIEDGTPPTLLDKAGVELVQATSLPPAG